MITNNSLNSQITFVSVPSDTLSVIEAIPDPNSILLYFKLCKNAFRNKINGLIDYGILKIYLFKDSF